MTELTMANDRTTSTELATLGHDLQIKIAAAATQSKAANTLRAYQSDMRQIAKYLADTGHTEMVRQIGDTWQLIKPMPAALIAAYLVERAEVGTALTSLQRHLASLSKWHAMVADNNQGMANPCKTQLVRDTLAGLKRANKRTVNKARPLMTEQIGQILPGLDMETRRGIRDKAVILLGWCGGMRRSELANLTWSQVRFMPEGLQITITQAKTDKQGEGQVIGLPYQGKAETCPVRAVLAWAKVSAADTQSDLPVFTRIAHNGNYTRMALSGQAIGNIISACAARVGLQGFTGHSLRAGLITEAIAHGRAEHEVMNTTRHKSQAVFRGYVRDAELFTKAASRGLLS